MKKMGIAILGLWVGLASLAGCTAKGEDYAEKLFTAAGEVTALRIDARDRRLALEPSEDGRLHIAYYESDKEFYTINETDEGAVTMAFQVKKNWSDYIGGSAPADSRTIRVQVPADGLASLRLSTTNEDIDIPSLTVSGSVFIQVNNGHIAFERLDVGETLELTAKNGDVTGRVRGGYDDFSIACAVKKGTCNLPDKKDGGKKSLRVTVNHGDVDIQLQTDAE